MNQSLGRGYSTLTSSKERYRQYVERKKFGLYSHQVSCLPPTNPLSTPRHAIHAQKHVLYAAFFFCTHRIPSLVQPPISMPTFCSKPPTVPSSPYRIPPNPPAAAPIAPSREANLGYFSWTCVHKELALTHSNRTTYKEDKGKGINIPPTASSSPQHNSTHLQSRPPYATTRPHARNTSTPL
jgi:hypothetical protein